MVHLEKITHENVWQVADAYLFAVCDDETVAVLKL